jgi:sarcosine oxidase subunit beta
MERILVAGSGAIGAFIAFHLAKRGARGVVLCDRGELISGSTSKAMGGVRQQFSTPEELALARRGIAFFETLGEPLFQQFGYLFAAATEAGMEELRLRAELQRSLGVPVETITRERIQQLAPGLDVKDLQGGVYCGKDGLVDPIGITREILRRASELGVELREHADVSQFGGAPIVVIAAGAHSAEIAARFGVELPIRPLVRQLFETNPLSNLAPRLPMFLEHESGFHFRRRGDCLRVAMGDPQPRFTFDARVDTRVLPDRLARLAHRVPAAANCGIARSWAGLYDMTSDAHPILDKIGDRLFVACGFSGHGFMLSPAVGELLSEWIVTGSRPHDLAPFSLARFGGAAHFPASLIL